MNATLWPAEGFDYITAKGSARCPRSANDVLVLATCGLRTTTLQHGLTLQTGERAVSAALTTARDNHRGITCPARGVVSGTSDVQLHSGANQRRMVLGLSWLKVVS